MTDPSARLDDPDEHFPYKREHIDALIQENPPAGPAGPDDDSTRLRDYISPAIAEASDLFVQAQAAHLIDQSPESRAAYKAAAETLDEARARHRAYRRPGAGVTVVGIRGAE